MVCYWGPNIHQVTGPQRQSILARLMRDRDEDRVESRFVDLESKIAFQEKTISDLNEVVIAQERALSELRRQVMTLEQQLRGLVDDADPAIERPPHY